MRGGTPGGGGDRDVGGDTAARIVPPETFHQLPRDGTVLPYDYESIHFEGLVLPSRGTDLTPFRATWYDITDDLDLCLSVLARYAVRPARSARTFVLAAKWQPR